MNLLNKNSLNRYILAAVAYVIRSNYLYFNLNPGMSAFTRYTALFLLTLFVRVLVPDSLVLALHTHTHTEEKQVTNKFAKHQVGTKHIHCQTDHLFNNSDYALPPLVMLPIPFSYSTAYQITQGTVWKFTFPNNICLRGPPQASLS